MDQRFYPMGGDWKQTHGTLTAASLAARWNRSGLVLDALQPDHERRLLPQHKRLLVRPGARLGAQLHVEVEYDLASTSRISW